MKMKLKRTKIFLFFTLLTLLKLQQVATAATLHPCLKDIFSGAPLTDQQIRDLRRGVYEPLIQLAEGGISGNGNGSGVACFRNPSEARTSVVRDGTITDRGKRLITRITALDLWDGPLSQSNQRVGEFETPAAGQDAMSFLREMLEKKLSRNAPYFARLIEDALRRIHIDQTQTSTAPLELLSNTGRISTPIPEDCRRIALAHRHTLSIPDHKTVGWVEIDPELFSKMNPLNQAALLLDEAMAMVMTELGHTNSEKTREFVAYIFSRRNEQHTYYLGRDLISDASRAADITDELKQRGFGQLLSLYLPTLPANAAPSSWTRQRTYLESWSRSNFETEEGAFLFLASLGVQNGAPNVQDLILGDAEEDSKLAIVCNTIRSRASANRNGPPNILFLADPGLYRRAISYCSHLEQQGR